MRNSWRREAPIRSTGRWMTKRRRSPSTTRSGTTGKPKGVHVHPPRRVPQQPGRAARTRMSSTSVYLWTLPMFHCNGWCYPWAVTAIGGTHVCLRKLDPAVVWQLIREQGVTHFCAAPTVLIALVNHPDGAAGTAGAPADHLHRRGAALADDHRPGRGARGRDHPRLWPDGGLRPLHGLRVAVALERSPRRRNRPGSRPARASATSSPTTCAS